LTLDDLCSEIRDEIFGKPRESMLLLVPSFLYLLQNNLLFVAVANLEAAVYQVTSQLKILTTAFFSVILLSRKLEVYQIAALILLTVGCIVVQLGTANAPSSTVKTTGWGAQTVGLVCALLAQCTSGFAGVFCEKMLKGGGGASMTVRNIQLGAPALVFGLAGVLLTDFQAVTEFGFFQGYTKFTWMVIMLHSFGGLLVTVIMKFADNIAKTFAIAVSLVVSTVMSVFLFDFAITSMFFLGGAMVIYATFAFSGYGTFGIGRASFTRKAVPAGSSNNESK
jgi:UDP-sugar transporter A1/2/3